MNELGNFGHVPFTEKRMPLSLIVNIETSSKKRKKSPTERDSARRWNELHKPRDPNYRPGQPEHREQNLNLGIIRRSQRRAKRPH